MPVQTCPNCLTPAEAEAVFCERCGLRLPTAEYTRADPMPCPACGTLNLPGETYCQKCGVVLGPVAGQPPPLPRQLGSTERPPASERSLHPKNATGSSPQRSKAEEPEPEPALEPVFGSLRLRDTGKLLVLPAGKPQALIGRADAAEGFFPDIDLEPLEGEQMGVSRRHALLSAQANQMFIEDLNSTNFTFINHQVLPPGQKRAIRTGDALQFGNLVFIFEETS